jgi:phosphomannomutase
MPTPEALRRAARTWLRHDPDPETRAELEALLAAGEATELAERFSGPLRFGTAGIRGLVGAGESRMNRAVVRRTTHGLARYLLEANPEARRRGVVVGRDARRGSAEFAEDTAGVLAAAGIPALVLPGHAPTPLAAFAGVALGAAATVVVTASHNPPEYNGYKAYWDNGAQIIPPHDAGIAAAIAAAPPADAVPLLDAAAARVRGLWRDLDEEPRRRYLDALAALPYHPGAGRELRLVYTALHGVGGPYVLEALARAGFGSVFPVPEQQEPDACFPTVRFPNPEEPGALDLAKELAERERADLVLANDPDADRLAVAVREADGTLRLLNGNEIGVLLGHYRLTQNPAPPGRPLVVTTIVSSAQLGVIARDLGAQYDETLTGFKWLMNRALEIERERGASLVFAYEEALGYGVGRVVRDKDGISAALAFADLAGWCRARGTSVLGYLEEIQRAHGLFLADQKSFVFPGSDGVRTMAQVMEGFRQRPPERFGALGVTKLKDYQAGVAVSDGVVTKLSLPASNVLAFELTGGSRVTIRPSGTEPKLKYYFELREEPRGAEPMPSARARGAERLRDLVDATLAAARERGQPA